MLMVEEDLNAVRVGGGGGGFRVWGRGGGVGGGDRRGVCLLLAGDEDPQTLARLRLLEDLTDGFRVAEADLRLRGVGEWGGTRQHGDAGLRVADLKTDGALLAQAREDAQEWISRDPSLEESPPLRQKLRESLPEVFRLLRGA